MSLIEIFTILIIHWIADFVFQKETWAKNKSKKWDALLIHTITYSFIWLCAALIIDLYTMLKINIWYFEVYQVQMFVLITFITHTITDYFTSRLNSKLWAKGKTHLFFVSIGFDQILHYIQLFTTYYLLKS